MEEKNTVIDKFLELNHPEKFNFLSCYTNTDDSKTDENIILKILKYKKGICKFDNLFNESVPLEYQEECDKLAFFIYQELGWQTTNHKSIRGDTMNSFWNVYSRLMNLTYENARDTEFSENGIACRHQNWPSLKSLDFLIDNFDNFKEVHEQNNLLKQYAELTYTIGNFIAIPHMINTGRARPYEDYWDLAMHSLYEFLNPLESWETFINYYLLDDYVDGDTKKPIYYWATHEENTRPKTINEINEFLGEANKNILERGEKIVKKCKSNYQI